MTFIIDFTSPYFLYTVLVSGIVTLVILLKVTGLIYRFRKWLFNKHYEIFILETFGDSFKIVDRFIIPFGSKPSFKWKKDTYTLNPQVSVFTRKSRPQLFYKSGQTKPLTFIKPGNDRSAEIIKNVVETQVQEKFLKGGDTKIYLIIIAIMGVCLLGLGLYSVYTISDLNNKLILALENMKGGFTPV